MERMTPDTIDFNSLSKKQLVELVITKYNDCFRLEEENKNLKLIQETNEKQIQNDIKERDELREENKKLKKYYDRDKEELMESCYSLAKENDELKKELEETKNTLNHRDSFFSIMRDVLANETITNSEIAMITYCVVHDECGDYDLSKKELEVVKKFWNREYV